MVNAGARGTKMLGLVGLLGALMAGVLADSILAIKPVADDDTAPDADGAETVRIVDASTGSDTSPDDPDYQPVSTDTAPAIAPDRSLVADADGAILSGGAGQDTLAGGDGVDDLTGRGGDDTFQAGAGNDTVFAGAGNDTAVGGTGDDRLEGEDGRDWLDGDDGRDALAGHAGADTLQGGGDNDALQGGGGGDALAGGDGDDWLAGGWDDDALAGDAGADTLDGGAGRDTLFGGDAWVDFLNGGDGDDVLSLGAGDYGTGQAGADQFALADYGPGSLPARIMDYDGAEDEIVVMYDPAVHPDPTVTTAAVEGSDDVSVLLDGVAVAVVQGGAGLMAADIRLMAA